MAIERTWYDALVDDDGSNTLGTPWTKAQVDGLLDTIDNEVRASAYNNAVQSIADSSFVALTFNSEDYDVGAMHSTSSNTSRITVPTGHGGLYLITTQVVFATSGTGARSAQLFKNGATALCYQQLPAVNATLTIINLSFVAVLIATDYIEVRAFQTSGGSLNTGGATRDVANHLQLTKIR